MKIKSFAKKLLQELIYKIRRIKGEKPGMNSSLVSKSAYKDKSENSASTPINNGVVKPDPDLWPWIRRTYSIRTIIDIGASNGDFAAFLADYFKPESVYLFEPLPHCLPSLKEKAAAYSNFFVFTVALSDHFGQEPFFVNSSLPSSSMLRISSIQKDEFPQTSAEIPSLVQVSTLDEMLDFNALKKDILIKIDVQGVEDKVIKGGQKVFSAALCVLIEMSFVSMYKGQPLFEEVHALLVKLGFRFAGVKNQIYSSKTGAPLFAHCLYLNTKA